MERDPKHRTRYSSRRRDTGVRGALGLITAATLMMTACSVDTDNRTITEVSLTRATVAPSTAALADLLPAKLTSTVGAPWSDSVAGDGLSGPLTLSDVVSFDGAADPTTALNSAGFAEAYIRGFSKTDSTQNGLSTVLYRFNSTDGATSYTTRLAGVHGPDAKSVQISGISDATVWQLDQTTGRLATAVFSRGPYVVRTAAIVVDGSLSLDDVTKLVADTSRQILASLLTKP